MAKVKDLTKLPPFEDLCVLARAENSAAGKARWLCRCSCGNELVVLGASLVSGMQVSCGCKKADRLRILATTHGMSGSPEHRCWKAMNQRCYNQNATYYSEYGGRGIRVCDRWRYSFKNFLADMGHLPASDSEIEREDNNGNYEPGNCVWSTRKAQCNNRRNNIRITYQGETLTLAQWSERLGFDYHRVKRRIRTLGWSFEDAISTPSRQKVGA